MLDNSIAPSPAANNLSGKIPARSIAAFPANVRYIIIVVAINQNNLFQATL